MICFHFCPGSGMITRYWDRNQLSTDSWLLLGKKRNTHQNLSISSNFTVTALCGHLVHVFPLFGELTHFAQEDPQSVYCCKVTSAPPHPPCHNLDHLNILSLYTVKLKQFYVCPFVRVGQLRSFVLNIQHKLLKVAEVKHQPHCQACKWQFLSDWIYMADLTATFWFIACTR